ncbi:hypothetical protein Cri9333_4953 (plasmid) [Crinalium epipsammum PCC 9333]|uniref:Uncharacterized protein n=1 Tax=Crinalium epipsammum PCC 9333 TaxID=1173022 RepID=K9W7D2_9CYAN|nr:hypothetical protein [Crinalium epipsammum]AFZ15709.1 hypothetical protein Cri9333_4953 [Crinalium epipsammum PCC 9333]
MKNVVLIRKEVKFKFNYTEESPSKKVYIINDLIFENEAFDLQIKSIFSTARFPLYCYCRIYKPNSFFDDELNLCVSYYKLTAEPKFLILPKDFCMELEIDYKYDFPPYFHITLAACKVDIVSTCIH